MVADRVAFLDAGHYAGHHRGAGATPCAADGEPATLLDLGGGTGHHLAGVLDRLPDAVGVVLDSSRYAARRAARAHPRAVAVVADTWARLPVAGRAPSTGCWSSSPRATGRRSPGSCAPAGGWSSSRRRPTTWRSWSGRSACSGWTRTRPPGWRRRWSRTSSRSRTATYRDGAGAGPRRRRHAGRHGAARPAPGRGGAARGRSRASPEPVRVTVSVDVATYRPARRRARGGVVGAPALAGRGAGRATV